jgi:hypothetical protein
MNHYTTNDAFEKMFLSLKVSQVEFGHLIESDKNSVHDWLKRKNQIRFDKLEEVAKKLNKKLTIKIED